MSIQSVIDFLEQIAPLHLQEDYDNAGLIVGNPNHDITAVMVCLDSTEAVIDEAIEKGCNLVVAHHPIIFSGLRSLTGQNYIERTIIKAIKNDIAIYAIHTNLDNVLQNGVNQKIATRLDLQDLKILRPKSSDTPDIGSGIIGTLNQAIETKDFLQLVKTKMQAGCVKYTEILQEKVQKIAICGGSGSFLLEDATRMGADVFITSDYKYHQFFDANGKIMILDIGHYESEYYTIELIKELLSKNFTKFAAHWTNVNTNPVNYL